jgi:Icc-related predicted phosphoesterase
MHPVSIRIAAAGDIHIREANREQLARSFAALSGEADLVLLAGDLTTHGEPEQGAWLAEACAGLDVPIVAVLGNHDWHANRAEELTAALGEGGITVLERESRVLDVDGCEVGIAGLKGFVGGFPGSSLPDFGEPLLREVYRHTSDDVGALDDALRAIAHCPYRIVLLHYAPCAETLRGEPEGIWAFLGNERIAAPIREHEPDLVLHGHAHAGTFEAQIGASRVYNVSVPVMGRDFWLLELATLRRPTTPIH